MLDTRGENIKTRLLNKSAQFMYNGNLQGRKIRKSHMLRVIIDERVLFRPLIACLFRESYGTHSHLFTPCTRVFLGKL